MSMISRQVAELREWSEHENLVEENRTMADLLFKAADTIEMLSEKAREPKQGEWIPCSERLPKKDGRYQVTRHDDVTNTEFIDILWYEENLWWNRHSTGDYAVTAWMPKPEPWKGADDED